MVMNGLSTSAVLLLCSASFLRVQPFQLGPIQHAFNFSSTSWTWTNPLANHQFQFSVDLDRVLQGIASGTQWTDALRKSQEITSKIQEGLSRFRNADQALNLDTGFRAFSTFVAPAVQTNEMAQVAEEQAKQGRETAELGKQISERTNLNGETMERILSTDPASRQNATIQEAAQKLMAARPDQPCFSDSRRATPCDPDTPFREPDGHCTNLQNPTWGMANAPYPRILPSFYEDGFSEVRRTMAKSGAELLSPRKVSTLVLSTQVILDERGHSAELMQFGQFMAHEFTQIVNEGSGTCCPENVFKVQNPNATPTKEALERIRSEIQSTRGSFCIPIQVPEDDPVFKVRCIEHIRTRPSPLDGCPPAPRQQTNTATGLVDASAVYGNSKQEMDALRSFTGGRLRSQMVHGEELPPAADGACTLPKPCPFTAGDKRINATPNLAAMHTQFLRKHNQVADGLSRINPTWNDERVFQESRRIVTAIQQNIMYNEYLQLLLTNALLSESDLLPVSKGQFYTGFDSQINPAIMNEVACAAFRFGHALVDDFFSVGNQFLSLAENFFNMNLLYQQGIKTCTEGLLKDTPWKQDRFYPSAMRDHLMNSDMDVASFNINRGRDHGIRPYAAYREHYGLSVPKTWESMSDSHTDDAIAQLRLAYRDPGDIELYPGGVTERLAPTGALGPLFGKIISDQFSRSKKGDRFYFEGSGSKLTIDQIDSIRDYKLSKLVCETTQLPEIQQHAFKKVSDSNPKQACSSLPGINLELWREAAIQPPTQPPTQSPNEPPTQPPTQPPTEPPTQPPTLPPSPPPTQRTVTPILQPNVCNVAVIPKSGCCGDMQLVLKVCQQRFFCTCDPPALTIVPCRCAPNDWRCKRCRLDTRG